mgnify:CR=1 FL=1
MPRTINEYGEAVVRMTLNERGPLTDEERSMIRKARDRTPVYDEDCPPIPEAMHRQIQMDIVNQATANMQNTQPRTTGAFT